MAEHVFKNTDELPMHFLVNGKERTMTFVSHDMVMADDTVTGWGVKGTIKEILEERPSRGNWKEIGDGEIPTFYKVQLY